MFSKKNKTSQASATGKSASPSSGLTGDRYLHKCIENMIDIMTEGSPAGGKVFLVTDMGEETGSPSARRSGQIMHWMKDTSKKLKTSFPNSKVFCGSTEHDALKTNGGSESTQRALSVYPGNCAMAETAICREADSVIRFGSGSMGDFVVGGSTEKKTTWYKTCEEIISKTPTPT